MKKFISLILVAFILLSTVSLMSCGTINDTDVVFLWSDSGKVTAPDTLINCVERAMYIENIGYKHYGANRNAETQYDQAKEAINNGCAALIVELVDTLAADSFVELAKSKDIPVIFIGAVSDTVLESYDKCYSISADNGTIAEVQGRLIASYVSSKFKDLDLDGDGKISYISFSQNASVDFANDLLKNGDAEGSAGFFDSNFAVEGGSQISSLFGQKTKRTELQKAADVDDKNVDATIADLIDSKKEDTVTVELIITDNDFTAFEALKALQAKDYNTDKLKTRFIPIFTVGFEMDYKAYVLANAPEKENDLKEYYEANKFLCDLTMVGKEDVEIMIWNTKNVVSSGRIAGTVIEDQDSIAGAIAAICRNLIKDNAAFDGLTVDYVSKSGKKYLIPFIAN